MPRLRADWLVLCLAAATAACAPELRKPLAEDPLSADSNFCLAEGWRASSPQHTDCVLARYEARQRETERLRDALDGGSKKPVQGGPYTPILPTDDKY